MKYSFYDAAEEEFFAAIEYYEECQPGLGLRFSEEVYATIKRICDHPRHMHGQRLIEHKTLPYKQVPLRNSLQNC